MGSQIIQEKIERPKKEKPQPKAKVEVLGLLKQNTVLNSSISIDEIVMFTPLTNENITKIVGLQLKSVTKVSAQASRWTQLGKLLLFI
jgi:ATP-dependent Clp protease ATP-binding subunit ClpB